jgi:hypothetical protein
VGSHGSGINKLRDQLGVKVDVSDEVDEKEKEAGKKKKASHQKSKIKVSVCCYTVVLTADIASRSPAARKMSRMPKNGY